MTDLLVFQRMIFYIRIKENYVININIYILVYCLE